MGFTDSPDLNVLLTLAQVDAQSQPIKWSYAEHNVPRRAIIGHDSAGYRFQIKKFKYDSALSSHGFENTAQFDFNASRIGSDSPAMMLLEAGNQEVVPFTPITLLYDRFGIEILGAQMIQKYAQISAFDSNANQLLADKIKFIYDSYPHLQDSDFGTIPGTNINISQIVGGTFTLDSTGALP